MDCVLHVHNGQAVAIDRCPVVTGAEFRATILTAISAGQRIAALFGVPAGEAIRLICVLADDRAGGLGIVSADVRHSFAALTPGCAQAHLFEREICEQWGVIPDGHPWCKPVRGAASRQRSGMTQAAADTTRFFSMQGAEVHEVAVGPIHAGVIEPGHFRFQCRGEIVEHLEIALGYQHRGVERAMVAGPTARAGHYMETLAGDSTIGHMNAFCRLLESLTRTRVPARAQAIRALASELERVANHIGALGALAGDVGFLPTASYCGRIRGEVLNLTAEICGNRFGRGLVVVGGTLWDIERDRALRIQDRIIQLTREVTAAVELMFETPSVLARLEHTGAICQEIAREIGMVGPAARASGLARDIRTQHPYGIYNFATLPIRTLQAGDCCARAQIWWLEVQQSLAFIESQLASLPGGALSTAAGAELSPGTMAVCLTEGWRGEICHVAGTDACGRISFYKVVDPSFHNWFGLALAMRGQQISDFPLCNKSFNLSYCGHDL